MLYLTSVVALVLFGAVCHYLGMRRRRHDGETHGETLQRMSRPMPRPPK